MKNNDRLSAENYKQQFAEAMRNNDEQKVADLFNQRLEAIGEEIRAEYEERFVADETKQALAARGVRQLTPEELSFCQKFSDACKENNWKQAITNANLQLPETMVNSVFDDLRTRHPLLSRINFIPTGGAVKWLLSTDGYQKATWGKLCAEIVKELAAGFEEVDSTLCKLSAFLPVCKAMIELGAQWLDRYIREVLYEALANGMEYGIIAGTGADMPIGMNRDVGEGVAVVAGAYPEKAAITVNNFNAATIGAVLALMATTRTGKTRIVEDVILLVNPADYFAKVMPATTIMAPDGTYRNNVMPYPMTVMQSPAVELGKAIIGIGKAYIATAGIAPEGRIEYSDHALFFEDERAYIIKTYANGRPADNNAFQVLDISGVQPLAYKVESITPAEPSTDATLAALSLGSAALTPEFAAATTTYTAATTNATNTINATPADAAAAIVITLANSEHSSGVVVNNGSAITWATGENTVAVAVTAEDGETTKTYTVTVTKS